jgi:hypothetical protein
LFVTNGMSKQIMNIIFILNKEYLTGVWRKLHNEPPFQRSLLSPCWSPKCWQYSLLLHSVIIQKQNPQKNFNSLCCFSLTHSFVHILKHLHLCYCFILPWNKWLKIRLFSSTLSLTYGLQDKGLSHTFDYPMANIRNVTCLFLE